MGDHGPLKIKKEFKNLIRPLHHKEYTQLEENILNDGCRDPIITWCGYIVDGHNRYEICTRHNIPYEVVEMKFQSDEEAIVWICENQLGRRNISDETRKFLIGMQYETEKIISCNKNPLGRNQYSRADEQTEINDTRDKLLMTEANKTAKRIGNDNRISAGTVMKYAEYTRALEAIGSKAPEMIPKILSGQYKISHRIILEMARLSAEELRKINSRLIRQEKPYMRYSKSRSIIRTQKDEKGPTVKDMPKFDPDAVVTELTLTIPSWISSFNRLLCTDINAVSTDAKSKLLGALLSLKECADKTLRLIEEDK